MNTVLPKNLFQLFDTVDEPEGGMDERTGDSVRWLLIEMLATAGSPGNTIIHDAVTLTWTCETMPLLEGDQADRITCSFKGRSWYPGKPTPDDEWLSFQVLLPAGSLGLSDRLEAARLLVCTLRAKVMSRL